MPRFRYEFFTALVFSLFLVLALTSVLTWAVGGWQGEDPPFKRSPHLVPGLLLGASACWFVAAMLGGRFMRLTTHLLVPLSLLACIGLNSWLVSVRGVPPRVPTNNVVDLFQQPNDSFESLPFFVLLSRCCGSRTLFVAPGVLEELKAAPWQFQAYGRLAEVVTKQYQVDLTDREGETMLQLPHNEPLVSNVLGFKEGRYYSYALKYVIVEAAESSSPLYLVRYGPHVIIAPVELLPERIARQ